MRFLSKYLETTANRLGRFACAFTIPLIALGSFAVADFQTLESVAAEEPDKEIRAWITFQSVQRTTAIVALWSDSNLALEQIKYKNVGSGGGESGVGDPYGRTQPIVDNADAVEAALERIETFRSNHYKSIALAGGKYRDVDCPYDDVTSPVKDSHGRAEDPSVELSCGLRIVAIQVRGRSADVASLAQSLRGSADATRSPSNEELLEWRRSLIESKGDET
ncbi:MAG: hypothetical protein K0U72_02885 [Gammaproteobacteria bacterium]|nr:hypothetical protein [Gammaproteobacteria bacterium]